MKKITLLLVIGALFMATASQAQLTVGLKGGLNFATADVTGGVDVDNKTGYHFGAYSVIKLGPIGIQPEAYFSVQNLSSDVGDYDLSYLQVPVLLRLGILKVLYLNAGPQFGINLKAEDPIGNDLEDFKSLDTSIALGAGLDLPFGLGAQVRWVKSLANLSKDDAQDWKNSMVQLSVTFALIGKS